MEIIGYVLIDENATEIQRWQGSWGQCPGIPNPLVLPNGDQICAASPGVWYSGYKLDPITMDAPPPTVPSEISRRQCALQLRATGMISDQEALDMVRTGAVPSMVQVLINSLPVADRVTAEINFAAGTCLRDNILLVSLMEATGANPEQIDQFFIAAAKL